MLEKLVSTVGKGKQALLARQFSLDILKVTIQRAFYTGFPNYEAGISLYDYIVTISFL